MRVFLDANVLFSATDLGSATRRLLHALLAQAEVVTNPHAWEETRRNVERKRPQFSQELVLLQSRIAITHAFAPPPVIGLPEFDIPILAGAIGAHCTHLWTGDKQHFGRFYGKTVGGVRVVNGSLLADLIVENDRTPIREHRA